MPDVSRLAQVRARLDLPVARRASGLLEGRHRSVFKGHGQDFDDLHLYAPGEDVGDIDWKSSARAGLPIIRRFVRESNLNLVLVVDTGRTMGATAPRGAARFTPAASSRSASVVPGGGDGCAGGPCSAHRHPPGYSRAGAAHP